MSVDDAPFDDAADNLAHYMVELLCDPQVNPTGGSVPLEKIQNLLLLHHSSLYGMCVRRRKRRGFLRFVWEHNDLLRCHVADPFSWRLSLT